MTNTSVIIKTIGRPTLKAAIASAKREGFEVIVVSDGVEVDASGADRYVKLGKQWGFYGGMAANTGAALASTEFITFLDDDDEFAEGAGEFIRSKLRQDPSVDLWIGGVRFNTVIEVYDQTTGETKVASQDLCTNKKLGVVPGNVAMPTYRASIFSKLPFTDNIEADHQNLTDFFHIQTCVSNGYKIDWFGQVIYLVRPQIGGINGEGQ